MRVIKKAGKTVTKTRKIETRIRTSEKDGTKTKYRVLITKVKIKK